MGTSRLLLKIIDGTQRPVMPEDAPAGVAALAARCWAGSPAARPSIAEIGHVLRDVFRAVLAGHGDDDDVLIIRSSNAVILLPDSR